MTACRSDEPALCWTPFRGANYESPIMAARRLWPDTLANTLANTLHAKRVGVMGVSPVMGASPVMAKPVYTLCDPCRDPLRDPFSRELAPCRLLLPTRRRHVSPQSTGVSMVIRRDPLERDRWARLRFSIVGPLLAAPPESGELHSSEILGQMSGPHSSSMRWMRPRLNIPESRLNTCF